MAEPATSTATGVAVATGAVTITGSVLGLGYDVMIGPQRRRQGRSGSLADRWQARQARRARVGPGDWKTFRELAHFQYTNGLTLAELQSGRVIA